MFSLALVYQSSYHYRRRKDSTVRAARALCDDSFLLCVGKTFSLSLSRDALVYQSTNQYRRRKDSTMRARALCNNSFQTDSCIQAKRSLSLSLSRDARARLPIHAAIVVGQFVCDTILLVTTDSVGKLFSISLSRDARAFYQSTHLCRQSV